MKKIMIKLSFISLIVFFALSVNAQPKGHQTTMEDQLSRLPKGTVLTLKHDAIINKGSDKALLGKYCATCYKDKRLCKNPKHKTIIFTMVVAKVNNEKHRTVRKGMVLKVLEYKKPRLILMDNKKIRYIQIAAPASVSLKIKHLTNVFKVKLPTIETEDF